MIIFHALFEEEEKMRFEKWRGDGTITLRRPTEEDIDDLIAMCHRHAAMEQATIDLDRMRNNIRHLLDAFETPFCWVVSHQHEIVGYVSGSFEFSTWHMGHYLHMDCIYLEEPYRQKGLGSWIIEHLSAYAKKFDIAHIEWQTPNFNVDAIRFYESIGAVGKAKIRYTLRL